MERVVITGFGIISSIGNNRQEVTDSLRTARSGIEFSPRYAEIGLRSQVHGTIHIELDKLIDRKLKRFMGDATAFSYLAMNEAITAAELTDQLVSNPRTGLIAGSGGGSNKNLITTIDKMRQHGARKISPTMVPRIMSSTVSAGLATAYRIKGINYSISSACATSAHCIGNAYEIIQAGKQDLIFAGGGEEIHWTTTLLFDAMGALSSRYNEHPNQASRPYDANRDGFVISGGGGIVVLENLRHAKRRGAPIYAEITGYGATSDGVDMVKPSGEGAIRCMRQALANISVPVDYINTHATSTPVGDIIELEAIKALFTDRIPPISGTKSLAGHGLGAAGANEAIYTLLMMQHNFISASANISTLDEKATDMPIVRERIDNAGLDTVMSNSFGFGGTNATLVLQRYQD